MGTLDVGSYNYTIIALNGLGANVSDQVIVMVTANNTQTETTTSTTSSTATTSTTNSSSESTSSPQSSSKFSEWN